MLDDPTLPPLGRLDLSLLAPAANLALDEALLADADATARSGASPRGILRLWESPVDFVVLGVSRRVAEDVDVDACRQDGVPVLRRASGGGTVLQGPGCLNLAIVLPFEAAPALRDVARSYRILGERSARALGLDGVEVRGSSDLTIGDLKFAGSAQKRTPRVLLHHTSILYDLPTGRISRYLLEPRQRPEYRGDRDHEAFLTRLPLPAPQIRERLAKGWRATPVEPSFRVPDWAALVAEKYDRPEWNERF